MVKPQDYNHRKSKVRFQNVITFNLFFKLKLTSLSRDQKK